MKELVNMIKELLETCELNMDDMEPETLETIESANKLLSRLKKDGKV